MAEQKRRGKDPKTGRFVKGNSFSERQPGEEIIPHPVYPHLDTKGHPLPGRGINPYGLGPYAVGDGRRKYPISAPEVVHSLKLELLECATKEDIQAVYSKLFALTQTSEHGGKTQLAAIQLYLDRFFGKPIAEMNVTQKTTTTRVNVDLTALSEEELQTYLALQGKLQSNLALEDKRDQADIVIEHNQGDSGKE
jgi:hypothetical protein